MQNLAQQVGNRAVADSLQREGEQETTSEDETAAGGVDLAAAQDRDTTSVRATGSVSDSGTISVGGRRERSRRTGIDDDTAMELTDSVSGGVSYDPNRRRVGGNIGYSQTSDIAGESTTRGASASGYAQFGEDGTLEGGGGSASVTAGGNTVSLGGGRTVRATRPQRTTAGRWQVTWTVSNAGNVGLGASRSGRGLSAGYSGSDTTTGSRTFETRAQAQAFYDGDEWVSLGAGDARSLGEGDTITDADSDEVTGGGSLAIQGVTVGASIRVGRTHTVEVTGLGNERISVKVTDADVAGVTGTLGAAGISMTAGVSETEIDGYIVTFDLSTEAGRGAFTFLRTIGRLPEGGRGYTMQAQIRGSESQETTGASLLGVGVTSTNTTSETRTEHADGSVDEERSGTDATTIQVPFLGSYSESEQITATDSSTAENRTYTVRCVVSGSSTADVNRGLAEAAGVGWSTPRRELSDQSSRRWTVTSSFTQAEISRLVSQVRAGRFNHAQLIYRSGDGEAFADAVRPSETSWDQIDRALAEFVSETGEDGLALIRDTIGSRPRFDLTLAGDAHMTGAAGHRELATKIARWTETLDRGRTAGVGSQIVDELQRQRRRLDAISDPATYPDLPNELRAREMERTRGEVTTIEGLLDRVRSARRSERQRERTAEPDTGSAEPVAESTEVEQDSSDTERAGLVAAWRRIDALEVQARSRREACIEAGNTARRAEWIHNGAWAFADSAVETWGERHWYGDDDHAGSYEQAARHMAAGNALWNTAQGRWRDYLSTRERLSISDSATAEQVESSLYGKLQQAVNSYGTARGNFRSASRIYDRIRARHPEGRNNQFNGYTRGSPLPQERRLE